MYSPELQYIKLSYVFIVSTMSELMALSIIQIPVQKHHDFSKIGYSFPRQKLFEYCKLSLYLNYSSNKKYFFFLCWFIVLPYTSTFERTIIVTIYFTVYNQFLSSQVRNVSIWKKLVDNFVLKKKILIHQIEFGKCK